MPDKVSAVSQFITVFHNLDFCKNLNNKMFKNNTYNGFQVSLTHMCFTAYSPQMQVKACSLKEGAMCKHVIPLVMGCEAKWKKCSAVR